MLIVLSADHGVPESSPAANALGFQTAQYFNKDTLLSSGAGETIEGGMSLPSKDAIRLYAQPYIYLNHDLIAEKKLDLAKVQEAIADEDCKNKRRCVCRIKQ
ncbi:alkaline phosphatase family protein [Vibrio lentus]|nr:alkaline phosphatase family protein [Vibrio lentus]